MTDPTSYAHRLHAVEAHARHLMAALGREVLGEPLQARGWTFGFDRARRRLGLCTWKKGRTLIRRITVSRYYAALNGLDHRDAQGLQVLDDVIRHEIAHALDYERHGTSSHGPRWQALCVRVGADPTRVYEGHGLARVPGRYVATCPRCRKTIDYYRRPKRPRACADCCRRYNQGRYTAAYELVLTDRSSNRRVAYGAR